MLTEEGKRKLLRVADHIEAVPNRFTMSSFLTTRNTLRGEVCDEYRGGDPFPFAECGTAACIAGWVTLLDGKDRTTIQPLDIEDYAVKALTGIDSSEDDYYNDDIYRLFWFKWPIAWKDAYEDCTTPEQAAKLAARLVRGFVANDGKFPPF